MTKLNLGCGRDYKKCFLNIDIDRNVKADRYFDLNIYPYDINSTSIDIIIHYQLLEYIDNIDVHIKEIMRILKPNGIVYFKLPHASSYNNVDYRHKHKFSINFINTLRKNFYIKDIKFKYTYGNYNLLNYVIGFFINLNVNVTERLLCNYVGGIDELSFTAVKR